ncbi:erythromycin esterase family protein [Pyxidicoccus sp. MSG2]|uniref:erythromycin esterase family protein n=1 Tax=Pyxidicoccus sp. MSG2 TaxID=2996790 RepID=UPI00226F0F94|nr:erythromycin esterase family protein [Pyxidicoccus sp. MSG2]MCY1016824.1 erythromycin esterase family protein [Pyxidicoccus sp. MSG2]
MNAKPTQAAPPEPRPSEPEKVPLSGQVLDRDGAPSAGAKVDVLLHDVSWDLRRDALAATVQAGPDGRFEVGPLAPGTYGVAASLADGTVVFAEPVELEAGKAVPPMELRPGETPVTLKGAVVDEAGQPLPGAVLRVVRPVIPFDEVALLPPLPEGRFQVFLGAGNYSLVGSAPGFAPRMMRVEPRPGEPVEVRLERLPTADERRATVEWVKGAGVLLKSVEAGAGFEDLRKLTPVLKDARVVALGEATHGTREFFQLKHRMLEFLVSELGFTVFAIEANFTEARAVNEYVLTGKGDPALALAGLYFWTWNTEEVLELIRWMRRYNEDPSHKKKVKFYGVDMQVAKVATARMLEYLETVDAAYAAQVKPSLTPLNELDTSKLTKEQKEAARDTLRDVARRLEARRAEYTRRSSREDPAVARQDLTVATQAVETMLDPENYELRDRAMADNLRWILDHEGPGTKAVVWAHNAHVARSAGEWADAPMGRHLGDVFGKGLYVFGFAFNQGSFQALNVSNAPKPGRQGLVEFTVPPAPEDSLDATLASAGLPLLALDLRAVPATGPVREWWRRAHRTRDPGAIYSDEGYQMSNAHFLEHYDGLLFIERTTRARPNRPQPRPAEEKAKQSAR